MRFADGSVGSPSNLDSRFSDVPREERGRLSRMVLNAIPQNEKDKIWTWARTKTKAQQVELGLIEYLIFLAIGKATPENKTIHSTYSDVIAKRTCVGAILAS